MNDADLDALVTRLRTNTPLVRLAHDEAKEAVKVILSHLVAPKAAK